MNIVAERSTVACIDAAIANGVNFLSSVQLGYGEFQSYKSHKPDLSEDCITYMGSSPYITTFVLYSLGFVKHPQTATITQKAIAFFENDALEPGIWRFFTTNNKLFYLNGEFVRGRGGIVPDLDDTCCVAYALQANNINFNNRDIILQNRNPQGLFYTWLLDEKWRKNRGQITVPPKNDICCGVNANVLLYLGENQETQAVCQYLNEVVLGDREISSSVYFQDRTTIHYLISRAFFSGVKSLQPCKNSIVEKIFSLQQDDGSFGNALTTAFAVCTLLNFNCTDIRIKQAIEFLIASQSDKGTWSKAGFFISTASYYGSDEFTTSICLEAIARSRFLFV